MRLFIIRHGETVENQRRIFMGHHHGTLTNLGLKQAAEAAIKLKKHNFAHVYSSDLKRCVDTAEVIKEAHPETSLTFTNELRELNMGEFQGKGWDEADWESLGTDRMNRRPKGGESLNELKDRIIKFIKKLNKLHRMEKVLLVTHAGVIRQIISHFENLTSKYVIENIHIENGHVLQLEVDKNLKGKISNLPKHQKKK